MHSSVWICIRLRTWCLVMMNQTRLSSNNDLTMISLVQVTVRNWSSKKFIIYSWKWFMKQFQLTQFILYSRLWLHIIASMFLYNHSSCRNSFLTQNLFVQTSLAASFLIPYFDIASRGDQKEFYYLHIKGLSQQRRCWNCLRKSKSVRVATTDWVLVLKVVNVDTTTTFLPSTNVTTTLISRLWLHLHS